MSASEASWWPPLPTLLTFSLLELSLEVLVLVLVGPVAVGILDLNLVVALAVTSLVASCQGWLLITEFLKENDYDLNMVKFKVKFKHILNS